MSDLLATLGVTPGLALFACAACFAAGAIRGFAGFGLSALAMALLASVVPPVQLIPVFWFLEFSSSLLLMKGGWADADRSIAVALGLTSAIGLPLGLLLSLSIPAGLSKTVALTVLIVLAIAQLSKLRLPALATKPGLWGTGLGAGIVTGVSGAGGMVIALYALARQLPARTMRGTLNIYLLGAGLLGLATHLIVGTMTGTAIARGLVLILPTLAGVYAGRALFIPKYERFYKPACLTLLIGLAFASLARLALETS
ncbi:MAG: TSUP family transporter [Pseudomonadota bacterium]